MLTQNIENKLLNSLKEINKIDVYKNGTKTSFSEKSIEYKNIIEKLETLFENARIMPAFGVSLDDMIKEELKNGNWLEISFLTEQEINGLLFDKLLFKLEECYGFNLIRNYNNSYDGRCIFLDLDNLTDLNEIIR